MERDNPPNYYNNSQYYYDRINSKTLLIDSYITDQANPHSFNITLNTPLELDKPYDVYLESLTTWNAKSSAADGGANMGFILSIDEFKIRTSIAQNKTINDQYPEEVYTNGIFIPNEHSGSNDKQSVTHKGKKLNYICTLEPKTIHSINGTISNLGNPYDQIESAAGNSTYIVNTSNHRTSGFNGFTPVNSDVNSDPPVKGEKKEFGRFVAEFVFIPRK